MVLSGNIEICTDYMFARGKYTIKVGGKLLLFPFW